MANETASVNDRDLLSAEITEPITGGWSAELELDSEDAVDVTGRVTINIDDVVWLGTVIRGQLQEGRYRAFVVGGNGSLGMQLPAKHYMRGSMGLMLREIASPGGESISSLTDAEITSRSLKRWTRRRGTVGQAIAQVARESGANWRMLRDGTIWLGQERWDAIEVVFDELDRSPGRMVIAPDQPAIEPGTTFEGSKVVTVVTRLAGGVLRQELTFADATASADRMQRYMSGVVESMVGHRIDYSGWFPANVVSQAGDGSLDLMPDNELVRGSGIASVPIRHGVPGCRVKVNAGARVLLFFEDSNPLKPAAALWPDGSSVSEVELELGSKLTIKAPTVVIEGDLEVSGEVTVKTVGVPIALSTHVHPTAMGPSGPPQPGGP